MDVNVVVQEENKTSQHEPPVSEDIKIDNLIILKTIVTGAEKDVQKLY